MGDFIAVVVNFTNQKTEYADGGVRLACMHFAMPHHKHVLKHGVFMQELHTCTWLGGQHSTPHPHGDALLVSL